MTRRSREAVFGGRIPRFDPPVRKVLDGVIRRARPGDVAVFDADGTLWDGDLGEALFRWLLTGERVLTRVASSPGTWRRYEARVAEDRGAAYQWVVAAMAGLPEARLRVWCRQLAWAWAGYRPGVRDLLGRLREAGIDVWVVSASNQWVVEEGAALLGIPPGRVLGIRSVVREGRLTERILQPATCGAGKVEAIRASIGRTPVLGMGDSLGDAEMLAACRTSVALVGTPGSPFHRLALDKAWTVQPL